MGVIDFKAKWSGEETTAEINQGGARLMWTVTVDDPANDTTEVVLAGITVPEVHPDDETKYLSSVRVRRLSPIFFEVEANYHAEAQNFEGVSPTERPVKILPPSVSFSDVEEPIDQDVNGDPIQTVNGEGFDPPLTKDVSDLVLVFEKNVEAVDYLAYRDSKGNVNNAGFFGSEQGTARLLDITAEPAQEGMFIFYKQRATIAFRSVPVIEGTPFPTLAWAKRVLHEGFYEKVDGRIVRAVDENGDEMTKPVLLDAAGARTVAPVWLYWSVYAEIDFDELNIL